MSGMCGGEYGSFAVYAPKRTSCDRDRLSRFPVVRKNYRVTYHFPVELFGISELEPT